MCIASIVRGASIYGKASSDARRRTDLYAVACLGCRADLISRSLRSSRAVLDEALRRLGQHGTEEIYVESDADSTGTAYQLYHAAGFRVVTPIAVCRRDLDGPIHG